MKINVILENNIVSSWEDAKYSGLVAKEGQTLLKDILFEGDLEYLTGSELLENGLFDTEANKAKIQQEKLAKKAEKIHYTNLRRAEYPPIGDQLDALWKGGEDAEEMLAKVQAVKMKYPKPE